MEKGKFLFLILLIGIIAGFFLSRSCKKELNQTTKTIPLFTINDSSEYFSVKVQNFAYYMDSIRMSNLINILQVQCDSAKNLLGIERKKTLSLAWKVRVSQIQKDTPQFWTNAEELSNEVFLQDSLISNYIIAVDTLKKQNDSLFSLLIFYRIKSNQTIKNLLDLNYVGNKKFDSVYNDFQIYKQKNESRKYSVGIGAGIGITNIGTPGAIIGITISRNLFRFNNFKN